jgi:DedD protein
MDLYKERIVGALVLVALAVIVLPWLLDDENNNNEFRSRIPPQPEQPEQHVVELSGSRPMDELKNNETVIAIAAAEDNETSQSHKQSTVVTSEAVTLPAAFNERGFVIQLGSFSNIDNAQKLVARLQAAGHKAYLRQERRDGAVMARVLEGPHLEKADAEARLLKLRAIAGNSGIVVAFDPLKH